MPEKSTILIVDDELISRYTVEALLAAEGYNLVFAENGKEALEKARELIPDLMLLDVMMPDMDGFEVCQHLRNDKRLAELPIVIVTALDDRDSRLRGIEVGADDFMSKPFDRAELRARIRTITRLNRYRRLVETQEELFRLANYDTLTGLPNRNLLTERLRQLERASRFQQYIAVLALDLDGFQIINDSLGHEIGDKMLCEVAQRLTVSSTGFTVARLTGDEFIIVMEGAANFIKDVSYMAQRLLDDVSLPISFDDHDIVITATIGISVYPNDGEKAPILLKNADTALARAKAVGNSNTYQFFTASMNKAALERLILENQLRKVLVNNELRVYYQPQIELSSGQLIGMEALVRWQHPQLGLLPPGKFVQVAEEMGLIVSIGEWVLRTACQQNKAWQEASLPKLRVCVNVSSRQFQSPNLLQTIKNALTDSELNPIYLELELTESVLMAEGDNNKENIFALLTELQTMGIQIAVDDFGTGYSSLSYLKRFPVNTLKIDRSFVQDICIDEDDAAITKTIIVMAHSLRLSVVAEGVETLEQLAFLQSQQCETIQGYLFSHPLSVEEMTQLLQQVGKKPFCLVKKY
jgi:diguanylate cyclase (GGDEF)-like protein